jgi:hypothetical protein
MRCLCVVDREMKLEELITGIKPARATHTSVLGYVGESQDAV